MSERPEPRRGPQDGARTRRRALSPRCRADRARGRTSSPAGSSARGPEDRDRLHDALADLVREPLEELRCEQAHLRRPRRRVRPDDEHLVLERLRLAVVRHLVPDHLAPPPDDAPHRHVGDPVALAQQARDDVAQELRVAATWSGARRRRVGEDPAPRLLARPQALRPRRRLRPVERLPRHLRRRRELHDVPHGQPRGTRLRAVPVLHGVRRLGARRRVTVRHGSPSRPARRTAPRPGGRGRRPARPR